MHAQNAAADLGSVLARSKVLLANLPSTDDRGNRLRGTVDIIASPEPFMKSLPAIMNGTPIPIAASLAAYDRISGSEKPRLYDLWIKGKAALLDRQAGAPLTTLSAGVDYMVTDSILLGGFAQAEDAAAVLSSEWSLGGFATARLAENIYLDFVGAQGNASGIAMTTSLTGKWTADEWTFGPQARISYFSAYAPDLLGEDGAVIAAQRKATAELAMGPSVSYRLTTANNVVVTTGLKLDTKASFATETEADLALDGLYSGLEGTLNVELPRGTRWKSSLGYQGIGDEQRRFNVTGTLTVPIR